MGRGESCGGGQSSLGYLFGGGGAPKPSPNSAPATPSAGPPADVPVVVKSADESQQPASAGTHRPASNNYFRADGQNTGNFVAERPSTKVQSVPGGNSSLDYLFGGAKN